MSSSCDNRQSYDDQTVQCRSIFESGAFEVFNEFFMWPMVEFLCAGFTTFGSWFWFCFAVLVEVSAFAVFLDNANGTNCTFYQNWSNGTQCTLLNSTNFTTNFTNNSTIIPNSTILANFTNNSTNFLNSTNLLINSTKF